MSILRSVRRRLPMADEKQRLQEVAKESGVPFHTLLKIVKGKTLNPRIQTVEKLLNYVERQPA